MMQNNCEMIETLAHGYLSDSTQREISNGYTHAGLDGFQNYFHPGLLGESSLSTGKVNMALTHSHSELLLEVSSATLILLKITWE